MLTAMDEDPNPASDYPRDPHAQPVAPLPIPVLDYQTPQPRKPQAAFPGVRRTLCALAGIALPVICFVIAAGGYPQAPEWQSGGFDKYAAMLMHKTAPVPFYPLLIYSMLAMGKLLLRQQPHTSFVVRLGLYTGIALALQYALVQGAAMDIQRLMIVPIVIGATAVAVVLGWAVELGLAALHRSGSWNRWGGLVVGLIFVLLIVVFKGFLLVVPILALVAAPVLALAAYLAAAWIAWKYASPRRSILAVAFGSIGWLTAWLGAWRLSIAIAMDTYQSLPKQPPPGGCYIATAAARGHRGLVDVEQLRRLKAAEIFVMTLWPAAHASIRRAYDRLGPPLARRIDNPFLADLAYLSLKPAEWLAISMLRILEVATTIDH